MAKKNILKPSTKKRGPYKTKAKLAELAAKGSENGDLKNNSNENSPNNSNENSQKVELKSSEKVDFSALKKEYSAGLDNENGGSSENSTGDNSAKNESSGGQKQDENLNLTGKALIGLTDSIFPVVIAFVLRLATKGKKRVDPENLRMTKIEREEMEEVADAAAQELLKGLTPMQLFVFSMAGIYASKTLSNIVEVKQPSNNK